MWIPFEKWQACGNDFILVSVQKASVAMLGDALKRQASRLCRRGGQGIGADGIILLAKETKEPSTAASMTIINADGSLAANCGNGLRSAAVSFLRHHQANSRELIEELDVVFSIPGTGEFTCQVQQPSRQSHDVEEGVATVSTGQASVGSKCSWAHDLEPIFAKASFPQPIPVELGNRHAVFFTTEPEDPSLIHTLARRLESLGDLMPNVLVARLLDSPPKNQNLGEPTILEAFEARVIERGVGETASCGSGACAIVAAAATTGLVLGSGWYRVGMPGGDLFVEIGEDEELRLQGHASLCFLGELCI